MGDIDVVCYCPSDKKGILPSQFVQFAAHNNVTIDYIQPDPRFVPEYPHGNKLLATKSLRKTSKTLFLDTDTVIWQQFDPDALITENVLSVAPEGRRTWGKPQFGEDWGYLYDKFQLPHPQEQIKLARTGALSLPYFNAGVVGFANQLDGSAQSFGELWLETAVAIDQDESVPKRRPWVDQISMPIAIARTGWSYKILSNAWNLSLSRHSSEPIEEIAKIDAEEPYILHYHRFRFLEGTRYTGYFDSLVAEFTTFSSFNEMMRPFNERSAVVKGLEAQIQAIRKMPKTERIGEIKEKFAALKATRIGLVKSPQEELYKQWPDYIIKT